MLNKLSSGWTVILLLCVFGFTACGDDDADLNLPEIGTITDIAADDTRFTTLVSALQRAGLDGTLDTPSGRYTVFAPTNDAFAASGIDLGALSDAELRNILLYHVLSGDTIYRTENIRAGETRINTLNTEGPSEANQVVVNSSGSGVTVDDANVVVADILAVNGVIHAIDQVLMPTRITDLAVADGRFTTLVAALQRVGLDDVFSAPGDFTVFAPTDQAFTDAGITSLDAFSDEELTNLLRYHVLGTAIPAGSIADGDSFVATLSESGPDDSALSLLINKTDDVVTVNGDATVVVADVFGANGVIHAIDKVLEYQSIVDFATKADALSSLAGALTAADLVDALSADGPFTVFAPTNDAFTAAADTIATLTPAQVSTVLTYHVVSGNVRSDAIPATANTLSMQSLTFTVDEDDATMVTITTAAGQEVPIAAFDIQGTNGVVHVIGTVLVPEL